MKTRMSARSIVSTALFVIFAAGCNQSGATNANAQPFAAGDSAGRGMRGGHDPARFLQRFDRDGNGTVQLAELPAPMQARFGAADTDHDGTLAPAELTAFEQTQRAARFTGMDTNNDGALTAEEAGERGWAHMSAADTNGDGRVTQAEIDAARAAGTLRGGPGEGRGHGHGRMGMGRRGPPDPAQFAQRFDRDGNGTLQVAELPAHMQARLGTADADHDGTLSAAELSAAFAAPHAEPEAPAAE